MKRIALVISIMLVSSLAFAQRREIDPKRTTYQEKLEHDLGYKGFVDASIIAGSDGEFLCGFGISSTQGRQLTPNLFAGMGAGINYYEEPDSREISSEMSSLAYDDYYAEEYYPPLRSMVFFPLFLNAKWYFGNSGSDTSFLSLDAGYSFLASFKEDQQKVDSSQLWGGIYYMPEIGYSIKLDSNTGVNAAIGWKVQKYSINGESKRMDSVVFSIAFFWK